MHSALARQFLIVALLVSIGLRTVFGAPCCFNEEALAKVPGIELAAQGHSSHAEHAEHSDVSQDSHGDHGDGHGDDSTAKPCCSACGPTLPADPVLIAIAKPATSLPEPEAIRALATRPPFPAYDATGPPLQV